MKKVSENPLEQLSLEGLSKLKPVNKTAVPAGAPAVGGPQPAHPRLDALSKLPGKWVGTGFNLIELPNLNQALPGPPPTDEFRLKLSATSETLTFSEIHGDIINRGNAQGDIQYLGLHYLQQVADVNLPEGHNGIHLETGLLLNVPATTDPQVGASIARLASIPHGDSLLAQGTFIKKIAGPPVFNQPPADSTPFIIAGGVRTNVPPGVYLSIISNAVPPPGIPSAAKTNPNIILQNAIAGQKIIETTVIFLDANPITGVSNLNAVSGTGALNNIPFVNVNANATTFTAIFWIETVENSDGSTFLQLQYTQTVILDFPVLVAAPVNAVTMIKWPHISVATLRKE